jgi:short-subunit dehydrogenase
VLASRREKELGEVASRIETRALVVRTDVTRRDHVERLRDQAVKEYWHVDVWVNNAGRGITMPVMSLTDQDMDEIVAVVLKSVVYGMQTIITHLQERGRGHLVNISSFLRRVPLVSFRSIYRAAKSGANMLTANASVDLKAKYPNIHVSLVMPGTVDTDFHRVAGTPSRPVAGTRLGASVVESAHDVASKIVGLIENPVPELYTNPSMTDLVLRYCQDVGRFEENMARQSRPN